MAKKIKNQKENQINKKGERGEGRAGAGTGAGDGTGDGVGDGDGVVEDGDGTGDGAGTRDGDGAQSSLSSTNKRKLEHENVPEEQLKKLKTQKIQNEDQESVRSIEAPEYSERHSSETHDELLDKPLEKSDVQKIILNWNPEWLESTSPGH